MQIEEKNKKCETLRCLECRKEFSLAFIEETNATVCPGCGTPTLPLNTNQDVNIKINWHELRILTIWAQNFQDQVLNKDPEQTPIKCIEFIVQELEKQKPKDFPALSIMGELQDVADAFNTKVTLISADGKETVVEKKTIH